MAQNTLSISKIETKYPKKIVNKLFANLKKYKNKAKSLGLPTETYKDTLNSIYHVLNLKINRKNRVKYLLNRENQVNSPLETLLEFIKLFSVNYIDYDPDYNKEIKGYVRLSDITKEDIVEDKIDEILSQYSAVNMINISTTNKQWQIIQDYLGYNVANRFLTKAEKELM